MDKALFSILIALAEHEAHFYLFYLLRATIVLYIVCMYECMHTHHTYTCILSDLMYPIFL